MRAIYFGMLLFCLLWEDLISAEQINIIDIGPNTQLTRGRISISENVAMGPDATQFWIRLIEFSDKGRIDEFDQIKTHFSIIKEKEVENNNGRTIGLKKMYLSDGTFIRAGSYGEFYNQYSTSGRVLSLLLEFDLTNICISNQLIKHHFGTGVIGKQYHTRFANDALALNEPFGYRHSISFKENQNNFRITFVIAPSGCAELIEILKDSPPH